MLYRDYPISADIYSSPRVKVQQSDKLREEGSSARCPQCEVGIDPLDTASLRTNWQIQVHHMRFFNSLHHDRYPVRLANLHLYFDYRREGL